MKKYILIGAVLTILILVIIFQDKIKGMFAKKQTQPTGNGGGNNGSAALDLNKLLKKGVNGNEVKVLQGLLGINADGIFGTQTENALYNYTGFQKEITLNQFYAIRATKNNGTVQPDPEETDWWPDWLPWSGAF